MIDRLARVHEGTSLIVGEKKLIYRISTHGDIL